MIFFIASYIILYFILALRRLDWAVMLLLAALPSYLIRFSVFGIPSTLLEAMIFISFGVFVFKNHKQIFENLKLKIKNCLQITNYKLQITRYPFDIEIILVLIISWIAIITAGAGNEALGIWKAYFFEPILVYVLVINTLFKPRECNKLLSLRGAERRSNPEDRAIKTGLPRPCGTRNDKEKILWPLAISAFFISLIAVVEKFTGFFAVEAFWPRVTGPYPYPNALGLFLGPTTLLMVGFLFFRIAELQITNYKLQINQKFQIQKILVIILTIIIFLAAIFFARSEGALIGIAAGLLVFGLLAGKRLRIITIVLILSLGSFVIIYAPARTYAIEKITLRDLSGEIRKQQWRETWAMMAAGPKKFIFGTGLSGYQEAIEPYHQEGIFFNFEGDPDFRRKIVIFDEKYKRQHWQPVEAYMYPHNIFLNFWTELGLAGLILFIWIFIKLFYFLITNYKLQITNSISKDGNKYIILGLLGAMVVIVIHGLVDAPYFKNDLAVLFWVLLAMAGMFQLQNSSSRIRPEKLSASGTDKKDMDKDNKINNG